MPLIQFKNFQILDFATGAVPLPLAGVGSTGQIPVTQFYVQADINNAVGSYLILGTNQQIAAARGIQLAPGRAISINVVDENMENLIRGMLECKTSKTLVCIDLLDWFQFGSVAGLIGHLMYTLYDTPQF